jgi:hypothetical protein
VTTATRTRNPRSLERLLCKIKEITLPTHCEYFDQSVRELSAFNFLGTPKISYVKKKKIIKKCKFHI